MIIPEKLKPIVFGSSAILVVILLATLMLNSSLLTRFNYLIYDLILPLNSPEMSDDIVVVTIDNKSIQELGRWPWSRSVHADLVNRLVKMQAKAIGIDILFSEHQKDDPHADFKLSLELLESQRTVLIMAPIKQFDSEIMSELLPIPKLATSAAALGHVDVELDLDGLCRRTYLHAGLNNPNYSLLALAMLEISGTKVPNFLSDTDSDELQVNELQGTGWIRDHQYLIPFNRNTTPKQISYADILAGRTPMTEIKGKLVLVGAVADGLGDAISTPGAFHHERMPGIVLNAQILNALLQDKLISELTSWQQVIITLLLIISGILLVIFIPAKLSLIAILAHVFISVLVTIVLLIYSQRWFAPALSIVTIFLIWPLWSSWVLYRSERLQQQLVKKLKQQASINLNSGLPNARMLETELKSITGHPSLIHGGIILLHTNWPDSSHADFEQLIENPVLRMIAQRLKEITTKNDYIAHINGKDFAILTIKHPNHASIQEYAIKLLSELEQPILVKNNKIQLDSHIGLSLWPDDSKDAATLLSNAYTAMFKARMDSTEKIYLYSTQINNEIQARTQLEQALSFALERNELELYYQPQVDAKTEKITGVEALLRWNNPYLGSVSPAVFIPVAENIGLIKNIGEWIIEMAFFQLSLWNENSQTPIRMAINVSPIQFHVPDFNAKIKQLMEKYKIQPEWVELEITEGLLMNDDRESIKLLNKIKQDGMSLAIDDFGTGYSSLSNLRHFPLDYLKIDRSFTMEINSDSSTTEIILTILALAKNIGLKVIAEGVETQEQADFMRDNGCDLIQGYHYSKAVSAEEIMMMLE